MGRRCGVAGRCRSHPARVAPRGGARAEARGVPAAPRTRGAGILPAPAHALPARRRRRAFPYLLQCGAFPRRGRAAQGRAPRPRRRHATGSRQRPRHPRRERPRKDVMPKDYKDAPSPRADSRLNHPMLLGMIIGLLLGVVISLAVALWLNRLSNPFVEKGRAPEPISKVAPAQRRPPAEAAKAAKKAAKGAVQPPATPDKTAAAKAPE